MHVRTSFFPEYRRARQLWGRGPWRGEPDLAEFWHAGFRCETARSRMGTLCGYVLIPEGHPWHGLGRGQVPCDVHGDTTYCQATPDGAWRVGFDCGHFNDLIPMDADLYGHLIGGGMRRRLRRSRAFGRGVYRTMQWTIRETQRLAEQAREASV